MSRLYDIQQNILNVLDQVVLQEGEITPEQEEELRLLEESKHIKLQNYVRYFRNQQSDIEELEFELTRLANRKAQILNGRQRLLDHVGRMLGADGYFTDPVAGELKWNKPTGKLEIFGDADDIPAEYKEKVEDWWIDRERIKAALKDGKQVNGAKLTYERKMKYVAPNPRVTKAAK